MKILCCICFSFFVLIINAQSYNTILCGGEMPNDFKNRTYNNILDDYSIILNKNISKAEKKIELEFAVNNNKNIDELLNSGKVLFGDPLTNYVNKVADKALESNQNLRNKLRFYVIKSQNVNAYSTAQGIIFITIGLLSQIENEAQLAFIICHEAIHYEKNHSIEKHKALKKLEKTVTRIKSDDLDNVINNFYKYSRENETQADELGMIMLLETFYDPYEALNSMDVLEFSFLPFDEINWNKSYFEDSFFRLSSNLHFTFNDSLDYLKNNEKQFLDLESTHPEFEKRKENLMKKIDEGNKKGNLKYIIGSEEFNEMQKLSRFELAYIYITNADFEKAFYHAFLLDKVYQNTPYFDEVKLMSIYGIMVHRHSMVNENYNDAKYYLFKGESKQLVFFLNKIKKRELTILCMKYAYQMHIKHPENKLIYEILNDVSNYFLVKNQENISLYKLKNDNIADSTNILYKIETKTNNKWLHNDKNNKSFDTLNFQYAFIELFKNSNFKLYIDSMKKVLNKEILSFKNIEVSKKNSKSKKMMCLIMGCHVII